MRMLGGRSTACSWVRVITKNNSGVPIHTSDWRKNFGVFIFKGRRGDSML
jgi:hypothetical protein